jgi:hypothetical protein
MLAKTKYPAEWHNIYGRKTEHSADVILRQLRKIFPVSSFLEAGCGSGHWTKVAQSLGVADCIAADGEWALNNDLVIDRQIFKVADFNNPVDWGRRFDMAICLEVAEHVKGDAAEAIVESLTQASDVVYFGAAIPFQGGYGHINERWPSWWRAKFEARKYTCYDLVRPIIWHDNTIHYWYRQNAFCYVNTNNVEMTQRAVEAQREIYANAILIDAVHPEKYEDFASYRSIALRRLLPQIPRWVAHRIRSRLAGIG